MEAKVILWPRENSKGEYFLKLRISDANRSIYRPTGISIKKDRWNIDKQELKTVQPCQKQDEPTKSQRYNEYLSLKKTLSDKEKQYTDKIKSLANDGRSVTIDQLIKLVENPVRVNTVYSYFDMLIERFKVSQKLGQLRVHKMTLASLKRFENADMKFHDIDLNFLKRYETHLRNNGLKDTSLSIYFRTLRAVYNDAIGEGYAKQNDYPFGKDGDNTTFTISTFNDQTPKRAISKNQFKVIAALEDLTQEQETAREIFLFSYYCAGINFNDICKLRWDDFKGDRIVYTRTKTKNSKKSRPINTYLLPYSKNVIQKLRMQTGVDPENYIFPILNYHLHITPQQIENRIHKVLGITNKALKEIAKKAKIKENISTYTARHSWITHCAQSEKITPFDLQAMVGHVNINTTMIYVANSGQDKQDELMKKVIGL